MTLLSGASVSLTVGTGPDATELRLWWFPERQERLRHVRRKLRQGQRLLGPVTHAERTLLNRSRKAWSWTASGQTVLLMSAGPFVIMQTGPAEAVSPHAALYWWANHGLGALLGIRSLDRGGPAGDPDQ